MNIEQQNLERTIKTLEANILNFDDKFEKVEKKRNRVLNKLEEVVTNMDLTGNEKPKELEAKVSLINTFLNGLTHEENNAKQRVLISLKNKELEISDDFGATVVEMLKSINVNNTTSTDSKKIELDEEQLILDNLIIEKNIQISEGELKKDPMDYDDKIEL